MAWHEQRCVWCGKVFTAISKQRLCSAQCLSRWRSAHLTEYNRTANPMNKPGGVLDARVRRSMEMRGTGEGKAYRKLLGSHEHRVIAAEMIGRTLRRGEVVHHIDGDKLNNDPYNLLVFPSQADHSRVHPRVNGRWCK